MNKKTIKDSRFPYNSFTKKPYTCTPFKNFITYSQWLTLHSLMFKPTSKKFKFLSYSGIRFYVPIFLYISFVKRVKLKSAVIHSWLHPTTWLCSAIEEFFFQTAHRTYKTNSPYLIKKRILTTLQAATHQLPLCQSIFPNAPHIVKGDGNWTTSPGLYLKPVSDYNRSTTCQLPVRRYIIPLEEFTLFVSISNYLTTWYPPFQLPACHEIIQLCSSRCNCILKYSP